MLWCGCAGHTTRTTSTIANSMGDKFEIPSGKQKACELHRDSQAAANC